MCRPTTETRQTMLPQPRYSTNSFLLHQQLHAKDWDNPALVSGRPWSGGADIFTDCILEAQLRQETFRAASEQRQNEDSLQRQLHAKGSGGKGRTQPALFCHDQGMYRLHTGALTSNLECTRQQLTSCGEASRLLPCCKLIGSWQRHG